MVRASIQAKVQLRRAVADAVEETSESPSEATFHAKISQLRRLFSAELGCEHDELVFDEINDVHCRECGKDFTG
jgi:hypothetical protein